MVNIGLNTKICDKPSLIPEFDGVILSAELQYSDRKLRSRS